MVTTTMIHIPKKAFLLLTTVMVVWTAAHSTPVASSSDDPSRDVDKLMIVDCMLPGKIMRLGTGARYMSARRPVKTTGADCEIRGGEYVAYDRASYATSLKVWLPEAKAGNPTAQTYVGEMFEQGLGTTPDYETAVTWYRKAADQGYSRAQMNLGAMYERGLGVEQNELEALNWYRKATGMGEDELISATEYAELEAQTEELREALEQSQAEIVRLRNRLGTSQQELNKAQGELRNTLLDLEELRVNAAQAVALGGDDADVSALYEEIRRKEQQIAANQAELARIRAAFDEQQLQFTQQLSIQQISQAASEALLDLDRQQIRSLEEQVAMLTDGLQRRQGELRSSNEELASLRRQLDARAAGSQDAGELMNVIAQQQADMERMAHTTSFLEQELANEKNQLEAERQAYQQREQRLVADADILQVEMQDLQQRLDQTEDQLASYRKRLADSERLIQRQEAELLATRADIRELRAAGDAHSAQLREKEAQLGEDSIELAGKQGENAALMATVNRLEVELDRLRSRVLSTRQVASNTRGIAMPQPQVPSRYPEVKFGEYHALIIGNNEYLELPSLETPVNDAAALARVLEEKYGFKTQVLINADRYTTLQTLNSYKERLSENDNFLLYYAGHGALDEANERGYWLPVDAHPKIPTNWISNVTISEYINTIEAKHIMVIADSCYSGTLTRQVRPMLTRRKSKEREVEYYQKWASRVSRMALTSGGIQPVLDTGGTGHSIFARNLLGVLESNEGILQATELYHEVAKRLGSSGMNELEQTPTLGRIDRTGDLGAPFFFVPG